MYPFLDRTEFEKEAFAPHLADHLLESPPFSALYHTVLALGCQYRAGGDFDPGKGVAWALYETALGLFSDILVPQEALVNVQVSSMTIEFIP
jgi:hypothetical protein